MARICGSSSCTPGRCGGCAYTRGRARPVQAQPADHGRPVNRDRWNKPVIEPLVKGAIDTMLAQGVKAENVAIEDVSGSYELPSACSRWVAASAACMARCTGHVAAVV